MKLNALVMLGRMAPKLKGWIFSDGKFQPSRAAYLLAFFIAIMAGGHLFGWDNIAIAIGLLDEVSDAVGYAE